MNISLEMGIILGLCILAAIREVWRRQVARLTKDQELVAAVQAMYESMQAIACRIDEKACLAKEHHSVVLQEFRDMRELIDKVERRMTEQVHMSAIMRPDNKSSISIKGQTNAHFGEGDNKQS
jgi:hypothetical protein